MLYLALLVMWSASIYRIVLSLRSERTIWRTAFTVAVVGPTVSFTVYVFRYQLDQLVGVWNVASLVAHIGFVVSMAVTQIYVETLSRPQLAWRYFRRHLVIGAIAGALIVAAWVLAPIHDRFYVDLAPLADDSLAVTLYNLLFYVYLGGGLLRTGYLCLSQCVHRDDPVRSVSLMGSGLGCVFGTVALALWSASVVANYTLTGDGALMSRLGNLLLPIALGSFGLGILVLLVGPWAFDLVRCLLRIRALHPHWRDLTSRWPEVRLAVPAVGGPLSRVRYRLQRMTIEIRDADRLDRAPAQPPESGR